MLKVEVANLARAAGYNVRLESSAAMHVTDPDDNTRTDISLFGGAKLIEIDVSLVDSRTLIPTGGVSIPQSALVPGAALVVREKLKREKYGRSVLAAGGIFYPVVMDKMGTFGPVARFFIDKLVRKVAQRTGVSVAITAAYWTQRIVIAVRLTALDQMKLRAQALANGDKDDKLFNLSKEQLQDLNYVVVPSGERPV